MAHVAKLLDRECPRCGAPAGIKCRDLRRRTKTAEREHIARGWLDRLCPTCAALDGEPCLTPTGRRSARPHSARLVQPRPAAQRYGYAWIAADRWQQHQAECDALEQAGCVRVWSDAQLTADEARRTERSKLLGYLQPADVLVVWRLDRLARTPSELADIIAGLDRRRIGLCSVKEQLDSTRPGGEQLFAAIAAIARLEPSPTSTRAPRRPAPASKGGRPRLLDEQAHAAVRAMHDAGEHTIDQIAAAHGVSRPTVYRSLQRTRPSRNP